MAKRTKATKVTSPTPTKGAKARSRAGREASQYGLNAAETAVEGALGTEAADTRQAAAQAVQRATQADTHDATPHGIAPWVTPAQTPPPPTH